MTQPQSDISLVGKDWDSISGLQRFSHEAMATTFEIFILHNDARYAGQAARTAFGELDKLEAELSRFIEHSDISRINNLAANQPLQVGLSTFESLQLCADIYEQTNGAFDITVGALMDGWLDKNKTVRIPSEEQPSPAHQRTGMHLVKLDEAEYTVELLSSPVRIDLGGFGKGYAVDQMAKLLREWSIDTALISGGYSSVLALGAPAETKGWPVTLSEPGKRRRILACLYLQNRAVSASGLQKGRHIIDPRTARAAEGKRAAWACVSDAATADALSTAFMVMLPEEVEKYCLSHPDTLAMVILEGQDGVNSKDKILHFGSWKEDEL